MNTLNQVQGRIFNNQFQWDKINKKIALKEARLLDLLREACLIESYFAVYTAKMMELFYNDVSATSIFTIESFEAYTHYFILRKYLDEVGYKPISDSDIVKLRQKDISKKYTDTIQELVNFMMTELFAAHFFSDIATLTKEPVLKKILERFSAQEETHSDFAFDLLLERYKDKPEIKSKIIACARKFRHIGAYVLPRVSRVKEDNIKIIDKLNKKVKKLIGEPLSDTLTKL